MYTGCYYDYMTCTIINYHVQYLILDAQRRLETQNDGILLFFVYLINSIRIIEITIIGL